MRYIDTKDLRARLPAGWEERAATATDEVRSAQAEDRSTVIAKHSSLWRSLADTLANLSDGKCWYCESRQYRSDDSVDHFRPKNHVVERPDHPGYWWLAFCWWNYRLSCTFCNSRRRNRSDGTIGGKHDHFPLLDEKARAFTETDNLKREYPELLDPLNAGDTTLLWFGDDGRAYPRCSQDLQPQHRRATKSISMYHLNHPDIVEARLVLGGQLRDLVATGNDLFDSLHAGNPEAAQGHSSAVRMLQRLLSAAADHSTAARDGVRGLRDDNHPWIDAL